MQAELEKKKTIDPYEKEEFLPCFVYGTLKKKYHNHRLLENNYDESHNAEIYGYQIYSTSPNGQGIPAVRKSDSEDEVVCGELYFISKEKYISTLKNLDRLEGFSISNPNNGFYKRKKIQVYTKDKTFDAWIYLCDNKNFGHRIESGVY